MYKKVKFNLKGASPVLMHKFLTEMDDSVTSKNKNYGSALEQALEVAYFDKKTKKLYMPSTWILGAIRNVSGNYKSSKNKKKTIKSIIGGAVRILQPNIYFKNNLTTDALEVFSSPVVIQRARIVRHRPMLTDWEAELEVIIDSDLVSTNEIEQLLNDAGKQVGVGDFRIAKGGPYGAFNVEKLSEVEFK